VDRPPRLAGRLDAHHRRRQAGIPTVSFLVGPVAVGASGFARWARAAGRDVARATATELLAVADAWTGCVRQSIDLRAHAARALAAAARGDAPERLVRRLARQGEHERELFLCAHAAPDAELDRLCRELLGGRAPATDPDAMATLRALAELLPEPQAPALLLARDPARPAAAWLAAAGAAAERIADAAPRLAVAVACDVPTSTSGEPLLEGCPASRALALLREGALPAAGLDAEGIAASLAAAGVDPRPLAASIERLAADGADDDLVDRFLDAATVRYAATATLDRARSAAEQFLHALLESLPATAGRFRLNQPAGFAFGGRPAEVDMLCEPLRLAVEIDGYHHFQDAEAYRRDRRKDLALQRHGYLVLRFLAEDVVPRLEHVLETIVSAVSFAEERAP
jgi:very-short-patch-repair endonuclease